MSGSFDYIFIETVVRSRLTIWMNSCLTRNACLCMLPCLEISSFELLVYQIPDGIMSLGRFEVSPSGGLVQPGQTVSVTVHYTPENAEAHRESLCIKVSGCIFSPLVFFMHAIGIRLK